MTSHTVIRSARASDCTAIARIADATDLFPGTMLDDMIAGYLDETSTDIWLVAESGPDVIGFVFCEAERLTNGTWNMLAIGVLPEHQSQGIGAKLTRHLEDQLSDAGHRILIVETVGTPEYDRTQRFYLTNDYVEEARIRAFWDEGVDKLVYWKHL